MLSRESAQSYLIGGLRVISVATDYALCVAIVQQGRRMTAFKEILECPVLVVCGPHLECHLQGKVMRAKSSGESARRGQRCGNAEFVYSAHTADSKTHCLADEQALSNRASYGSAKYKNVLMVARLVSNVTKASAGVKLNDRSRLKS